MAFHGYIDRAKEQASSSGSGDFTMPGTPVSADFQAFVTKMTANGDTTGYCAVDGNDWEAGILTRVSSTVFSRTVLDNSAGGTSAVNFTNAPAVFSTVPGRMLAPLRGAAFRAYQSSNQTPGAATPTKVLLQTEEFDTNGCFASSTFTADKAGLYQFNGVILFTTAAGGTSYLMLYKNGSEYARGPQSDANSYGHTVSGLVNLAASDTVDLYVTTTNSRTTTAGSAYTWMSGHMVRAAG